MKRAAFIIIGLIFVLGLSAQDKLLKTGGKIVGLGESSDTLTASETINYVMELWQDNRGILTLAVESDEVSGTPAYDAYLQKSLNNEDWADVDTITHSGGGDNYAEFDAVNATHTYWRINIVATAATQKSNLKIWGRLNDGFVIEQ